MVKQPRRSQGWVRPALLLRSDTPFHHEVVRRKHTKKGVALVTFGALPCAHFRFLFFLQRDRRACVAVVMSRYAASP